MYVTNEDTLELDEIKYLSYKESIHQRINTIKKLYDEEYITPYLLDAQMKNVPALSIKDTTDKIIEIGWVDEDNNFIKM